MDYFGINSTADLPKISEVLMEELVQATLVNHQPLPAEKLNTQNIEVDTISEDGIDEPVIIIEENKQVVQPVETAEDEIVAVEEITMEGDEAIGIAETEEGDIKIGEDKQKQRNDEQSES